MVEDSVTQKKHIDPSVENTVLVIKDIKPDGTFAFQEYMRVGTYSVDEVLSFLPEETGEKYQFFGKFEVNMTSQRYCLFSKKGTTCIRCGIVGNRFHLERTRGQEVRYHFNLYGVDKDGNEIMITKDHIVPRSKGGKDRLDNYQPMCTICNAKKKDSLEVEEE